MGLSKIEFYGETVYLVRTRSGLTFFGDCPRTAIKAALEHVIG